MSDVFREEVLNVALAELLKKRGSLSTPERIRKIVTPSGRERRMPDITIAGFQGVRIVLEGRSGETPNVETTLSEDARRRVEEGIAPICIAVHYPPEARRTSSTEQLESLLATRRLRVKVFSESGEGEWTETDLDGLSQIIRRSYDDLVKEDIISQAAEEIKNGIESTTSAILRAHANPRRIRDVLGIRETKEEDIVD